MTGSTSALVNMHLLVDTLVPSRSARRLKGHCSDSVYGALCLACVHCRATFQSEHSESTFPCAPAQYLGELVGTSVRYRSPHPTYCCCAAWDLGHARHPRDDLLVRESHSRRHHIP
jgi:hypothetical protein